MKTLVAAILAVGLLPAAASAQYCPPGYGNRSAHVLHYGAHQPAFARTTVKIEKAPEVVEPAAPAVPIESAPAQPAPEPAPPK